MLIYSCWCYCFSCFCSTIVFFFSSFCCIYWRLLLFLLRLLLFPFLCCVCIRVCWCSCFCRDCCCSIFCCVCCCSCFCSVSCCFIFCWDCSCFIFCNVDASADFPVSLTPVVLHVSFAYTTIPVPLVSTSVRYLFLFLWSSHYCLTTSFIYW